MSFRHDTKHLTGQQQAIIRQRDASDAARKKEAEQKRQQEQAPKPDWVDGDYAGFKVLRGGDYERVMILRNGQKKLELRISGTAAFAENCGLNGKDVHQWLWNAGLSIAKEIEDNFKILMITSHDVQDGKLTTSWKNLREEQE